MLKRKIVFLILLLSLSHYINCDEWEDRRKRSISYLLQNMGACSEYFEYTLIDEYFNGKLTLPNMKIGDTVKMTFYEEKELSSWELRSLGILLPIGSSPEVINKLQNKQPISYRLDFPLRLAVPQLLKIFINDNELCRTSSGNNHDSFILVHKSADDLLIIKHTLNIINGTLQVFTYNIDIPQFPQKPPFEFCGRIDTKILINEGTPLAYGGKVISRGEYPWLAAIYKKQSRGLNFVCGGSLVTSKIILSAAHCFQSLSLTAAKVTAMLGRYNLTNFMEDGYTIHEIEAIILHPDYKPGLGFSDADLAVVEMKERVSLTKFIKPICLWSEPADESQIVNQTSVVVGWGSDEDGNSISVAPKKVNVKIVSREQCLISSPAFNALTSSRTLCAGNRDGTGPCEGDSGGGLMLNRNGVWMLRGVISLALTVGQRCDLQEYTVYCDVAKHMPWLQNYTKQQDPSATEPLENICGRSGTGPRFENPWLAGIYRKTLTGELYVCTGAIVSSRTVLTRANCVSTRNLDNIELHVFKIYLGRYDLKNINENEVLSRNIAALIFYPSAGKIHNNNIALLQLKDPVSFTEYVKPICLWSESMERSEIVGQSVTLSSWNKFEVYNEVSAVPTLEEVNISSLKECQILDYNVNKSSRMLCITRFRNNCEGILTLKRNGRWLLRGLSSWNYYLKSEDSCLYADLAEYASWLQNNILS